ncbi:UDP-N-acetylmuramoyl-L-alanyl-D-glutamate--2,6-diaminopimelate ligase [Knoellia remsis]|uniref:UDP-N-acetylmuramoyl-L-alanyl-D-glutamate--2, 6-diaminopimelate ligase n=1 Tax=Knoellia remsis TaxID=407159 RepID=A0A2T0V0H5_9MICO|nr:UDP-N-acetylmuramoyl-L-alanyl-D-glutamate--2,6-diaminopimelate ligase [Knoellia remsis]
MSADCALGDRVAATVAERGARLVTLGEGGDARLVGAEAVDGTLRGSLVLGGDAFDVTLPFTHDIAVTNALLAALAVIGAAGDPSAVTAALAGIAPPPGRLETVAESDGVTVMVDTAHNPGALRTALTHVRRRTSGRVVLVFGAGGERDQGKRPLMGRVAAELADLVVLTDDNPRREPPGRIRRQVRSGCPGCIEIPDRTDAIVAALEMARPGDVVLVAGKGDETTQLRSSGPVPHDDREVIRRAMDTRAMDARPQQ